MTAATSTPVIGILTQPIPSSNHTMIAASYVKWLEAGGARSIPIPYDASEDLLQDIWTQIDGVLFPGGASELPDAARFLWKLLHRAHQQDDLLPLWGTCLGFEYLLKLGSGNTRILENGYQAENMSLPLYQVDPYRLYKNDKLYETIQKNNITMNNHHQGISPDRFSNNTELLNIWKVTSINYDKYGKPFVSTIEPLQPDRFPVFGVQFHPEKNAFEYATYPHTNIPYEAIDHSEAGIAMSLYMADFFVTLAKRNPTYGQNYHEYSKPDVYPLVYDYPMERGVAFEQLFIIPPASHWSNQQKIFDWVAF